MQVGSRHIEQRRIVAAGIHEDTKESREGDHVAEYHYPDPGFAWNPDVRCRGYRDGSGTHRGRLVGLSRMSVNHGLARGAAQALVELAPLPREKPPGEGLDRKS